MKGDFKLRPLTTPTSGTWVSPEVAARLARNGRGLNLKYFMNKIYAGELNGYVKKDHMGWWIFIPERDFKTNPLKAA